MHRLDAETGGHPASEKKAKFFGNVVCALEQSSTHLENLQQRMHIGRKHQRMQQSLSLSITSKETRDSGAV